MYGSIDDQVEVIDRQHQQEEELDQSVTSKINLVDLAGSERQVQAQTSGERLRVRECSIRQIVLSVCR